MRLSRHVLALLAWTVVLAVAAYVAIEAVAVVLRPEIDVLRASEARFATGGGAAWPMRADLALRCLLGLAFVVALAGVSPGGRPRLRPGLALLAASALASGLLAAFPAPGRAAGDAFVACAFVGLLLGTQLTTMALRLEPVWEPIAGPLSLLAWAAVVPAVLLARARLEAHGLGGLYERIFLGVELIWLVVASAWIGLRAVHAEPRGAVTRAPGG